GHPPLTPRRTRLVIEQAIYGGQDAGGYRFLARSPRFADDWLPQAERPCVGVRRRPASGPGPAARVAPPVRPPPCARAPGPGPGPAVRAAARAGAAAGRPGALGFPLLVLPQPLYADLGGDPFFVADHFPPPWAARGELPALAWAAGAAPHRTVADIRKV